MEIKVTKNGREIICSGYVIVADGESVDFSIDGLIFRLSFETQAGVGPRVGMNVEKDDNGRDYMSVKCQNFDGLFRTVSKPLYLAKRDEQNIALEFSTTTIASMVSTGTQQEPAKSRLLFYCWFMEAAKKTDQ